MDTNPAGNALDLEHASPWTGYTSKRDEMPLAGYATRLAAFGATFVPRYRKLLSAPFVEYIDLLTCPWCIAPWVAATLYTLYMIDPRAKRVA
jgi:hypothetical protein